MKTRTAVGKKLMIGVGGMMAMLLALAGSGLYSATSLGGELDSMAKKIVVKTDLAGSMASDASELLSLERGVLVRVVMKDMVAAEKYHNSFVEQAKTLNGRIAEIQPLLASQRGRDDVAGIATGVSSWSPKHDELWRQSSGGQIESALQIYDQQTLPLAKEMKRLAEDLKQLQRTNTAAAVLMGTGKVQISYWAATVLSLLALLVGVIVIKVVLGLNRELRQIGAELSEGAEEVNSAASQVSSSSQVLAQGSSEQAASLEETSASTEQITSMTRKNAENSQSAAEVMTTVDNKVKECNRTLEQMVASMHEINSSSEKISKIIKVIDEIAFQTNILALNAAVEAARAGEAGMGFAVVADEVRNLAQRSAQAAKDTASLIEDSISKSHEGSDNLQKVTEVIHSITESAAKVKTLVDEVNLGSHEQSRGIDQIAKAISQIEQVTQSTAASAEESASASEELLAQGAALNNVVAELRAMVEGNAGNERSPVHTGRPPSSLAPKAATRDLHASGAKGSNYAPKHMDAFPLEDSFKEI